MLEYTVQVPPLRLPSQRVNRVLSQCGTQWWVGRGLMGVGNFVPRVSLPTKDLFGKWRIQVDGRGLKGILRNFDL
jgi:hypothetical protein